ncbi:TPA: PriCT-2 domain-containing protein [Burkholderia aenigmatica]|uniref:PriCT-2 domain-containing protein n=1 Tax=Burkholderia sp. AU45251 TaxID=3059204 RepID=UPI002654881F|nr:PriCT-2 domain-containing protein [Burkholderia sp. AU45251]HDR9483100.1 PriCT-2 domain-containing protein [Burkholderia aenigmatica]MDN7515964.1 PriCT-2 domain-containing protein [Burkholderia sp. AU45251]HDR9514048.1 PriCT-2 domain-containing protein [Burkholderia aenigmatica]HDR9591438.1 PriCT-2 domain-containing protein [Burkholderia aenigmatica]HDR9598530.1 PriCT-2 domain-containing protein [Burkholderia aenigmatica]
MTTPYVHDADRARAALAVIPADDYETWVDMAFALKQGFGDEGFEIWDAWSRTAANYNERAARTTWRSASASGGKTLATLFWQARQHGFDLKRANYPDRMTAVLAASPKVLAQRAREEAQLQARHAVVAHEATSIWQWARPVGPEHPYLVRKQLEPAYTLRELDALELRALLGYLPASEEVPLNGRVLIVPVWNGSISTLELIDEHGHKSSLAGGAKRGGYWTTEPIWVPASAPSRVLIAEGMATALAASRATGWFATAALSSGNLGLAAQRLREQYPAADLIVLGELGSGEAQARCAAEDARAHLVWPRFAADARIHGMVPNDFSDMVVLSGFEAVGEYLRAKVRSVVRADGQSEICPELGVTLVDVNEYEEGGKVSNVKEKLLAEDDGTSRRRPSKRGAPKQATPDVAAADSASGLASPSVDSPPNVLPVAAPLAGDPPRFASTRPSIGEPLFGVGDVPNEVKALAEHRFGSPLRLATPRENGGPYRGEVFNTEHYLIQQVATRSVVFHRKDRMTFVSDRLKWMDEKARLNGSELQVGYDGDQAKVYPWDRARDLLDRMVGSLKKSARELNYSPNLEAMLDQLQARSWTRIREARAAALEKSREQDASREAGSMPDR